MVFLIVDSSTLITERLADLIVETYPAKQICIAESFTQAIQEITQVQPDIVLLDMNLPGNKSLELFRIIKSNNNKISFIILFNQSDTIVQQQCESIGADFFFDKYHDFEKIPGAIMSIAATRQ